MASELLTARALLQNSDSRVAVVYGGRNRGIDISCGDNQVDAKHLTPMTRSEKLEALGHGCNYKMTRQDHQAFDADVVTHIGAVYGPEDMPVRVAFEGDDIVFRVGIVGQKVALIPTDVVNNNILHADSEGARVAYIRDEDLIPNEVAWSQ